MLFFVTINWYKLKILGKEIAKSIRVYMHKREKNNNLPEDEMEENLLK